MHVFEKNNNYLKKDNRDCEKVPKQGEAMVDPCDTIIFKIPVLTAANHLIEWNRQNREFKYASIKWFHYLHII